MKIRVKKLKSNAKLPYRATSGSAGYDLFAELLEDIIIPPHEQMMIPTGISIEIGDENYGGFVFPRSSLAVKNSITLSNSVGVIDSDYRGELKVPLVNNGNCEYVVSSGDRIAQLVIMPISNVQFEEADELSFTERFEGGFGSTGK